MNQSIERKNTKVPVPWKLDFQAFILLNDKNYCTAFLENKKIWFKWNYCGINSKVRMGLAYSLTYLVPSMRIILDSQSFSPFPKPFQLLLRTLALHRHRARPKPKWRKRVFKFSITSIFFSKYFFFLNFEFLSPISFG